MKANMISIGLSLCIIYITACCNPCNDKALIKPANTGCKLSIQWQMSQAVRHSNGTMTSSISIIADPASGVSTFIADSITTNLYAEATDTVCGIKCISYEGGFSGSCANPPFPGVLFHGSIPTTKECSPLTSCAFKSMRISIPDIAQYMRACLAPKVFSTGEATYIVIYENYSGQQDTSMLKVRFQ